MVGQYSLFAVLALALVAKVIHAKPPQPIINGYDAVEGEFPFMVSLRLNGEHICGGSIVTARHILTAAHCVATIPVFNNLHVVTGSIYVSRGGQSHRPSRIIYHHDYTHRATGPNDVAILALGSPIQFNSYQKAAIAPSVPPSTHAIATVSGWGYIDYNNGIKSDRLKKLNVYVGTPADCQKYASDRIYPHQLCTTSGPGHAPCHYDSGGPLSINGVLIGVVSWGTPCATGRPDVYSNVYYYKDWIKNLSQTT